MLPINITELLEQNRIESNRIEYKDGWNLVSVSIAICASPITFKGNRKP